MAKTEAERGLRAAWIVRHRRRLYGTDLAQLSRALKQLGVPAEVPTIRGWEAGAKPRPEVLAALERLFGEQPSPRRSETPGRLSYG